MNMWRWITQIQEVSCVCGQYRHRTQTYIYCMRVGLYMQTHPYKHFMSQFLTGLPSDPLWPLAPLGPGSPGSLFWKKERFIEILWVRPTSVCGQLLKENGSIFKNMDPCCRGFRQWQERRSLALVSCSLSYNQKWDLRLFVSLQIWKDDGPGKLAEAVFYTIVNVFDFTLNTYMM